MLDVWPQRSAAWRRTNSVGACAAALWVALAVTLSLYIGVRGGSHPHRRAEDRHAGWELDVIRAHGLDKAADLEIEVTELATTEAGKVAIGAARPT